MSVICVISARGNSQGLKNKNIKLLLGKPLIAWTIQQALATNEIDHVFVSTDSQEIAKIAQDSGAKIPFIRPPELSNSTIGKFFVWKHALEEIEKTMDSEIEIFVDLDCTNPLRTPSDISNAIQLYRDNREDNLDAIFSICEARKNPYFNLVEYDQNGQLMISKKLTKKVVRRQDAPDVFEHVASIYVLNPDFIRNSENLLDGKTKGYDIGTEKSFDIDSELDFEIIEYLLKKRINE
tara:strand:- start:223 stop:933 length:711 start_codon:yes stop_codon:yes gene_type:complete